MPTVTPDPRTLAPLFAALPPAIGAGAGNGNDVNVPATVTGRTRALAPLIMTRNAPDNGAVSATIVTTTAFVLARGGHSVPGVSASVTPGARAIAPVFASSFTLSAGMTITARPAFALALGMGNTIGAGATVSASAAISLVIPLAPDISVGATLTPSPAIVLAQSIVLSLTIAQSPTLSPAIALALGMSGFVDSGQTPSFPSGGVVAHDVIRANPRGGPAKAKREI